jgi:hypothetical protein
MAYNKTTMDKIAAQALDEIAFARSYKQGKIGNWQKNEEAYYSKKTKTTESRANVSLSRMQDTVHILLSKIDNPLIFKFTKRKNSQLKRVDNLNGLVNHDREVGDWDIKDIVGKKQAIIYGRAIYCFYADSINKEYASHLENVDVYDFLIDPDAGGVDIEKAFYLGDHSVVLKRSEIEKGIKNGLFIKDNAKRLLESGGNSTDGGTEDINKRSRSLFQNTQSKKEIGDPNKFRLWRWFTTWEDGSRVYLLMDNSGNYLKCEKLTDNITPSNKRFPKGAWPYWSWAAFLDMTEFWTPSFCDYFREIFMAQEVSVNQMVDNAEAINKPQKVVNVNAFENMAEFKYRRDGIIRVKDGVDLSRAYQVISTASINTPIAVFNLLETIQQKSLGGSDAEAGVEDTDGRVAIYEGNQAATSDRFGLLNKSYAFGYKRFAKLFEIGVQDNLIKKMAIEILGPDGVEVRDIKRSDIFKKSDDYGIIIEASNAQFLTSAKEKEAKLKFLQDNTNNQLQNQRKAYEMQAKIAGFSPDEVAQLQDISFYGNSELMSECDRDLEALLEGEDIKPNHAANNAYKQKMVSYLKDHDEDISTEQFKRIADYIVSLEQIIYENEARALQGEVNQMNNEMPIEDMPPNTPGGQKGKEILPQPNPNETETINQVI